MVKNVEINTQLMGCLFLISCLHDSVDVVILNDKHMIKYVPIPILYSI